MKKSLLLILLTGLAAIRGFAANGALDPVGVVKISCLGASDTIVSLPLNRPTVFEGVALASTTTDTTGTLTFSGNPFTPDTFKYVTGTQPNTYFAFIASGDKEGCYYTITGNTTNALTIDLNGDSLAAVTSAITVKIIPYWTLGTVFPDGAGVAASEGFTTATQVLIPDTATAGTNLSASAIYYYSASAGWMKSGASGSASDTILYPDSSFTIRNNTATTTTLALVGAVAVNKLVVPLASRASGRQDNEAAIMQAIASQESVDASETIENFDRSRVGVIEKDSPGLLGNDVLDNQLFEIRGTMLPHISRRSARSDYLVQTTQKRGSTRAVRQTHINYSSVSLLKRCGKHPSQRGCDATSRAPCEEHKSAKFDDLLNVLKECRVPINLERIQLAAGISIPQLWILRVDFHYRLNMSKLSVPSWIAFGNGVVDVFRKRCKSPLTE